MIRKQAKTLEQMDKQEKEQEHKRDAPKEFVILRDHTGLYIIKYTAGGEVPDVLKGGYTNLNRAQAALDSFLALRKAA